MDPVQKEIVSWGIFGTVAVVGVYAFIKWGLPGLANAAKKASQSVDAQGNPIDYSGAGPLLGPLASFSNAITGGNAASLGSGIGGSLFSVFGTTPDQDTVYYTTTFPDGSRHTVPSNTVDSNGRFSFGGTTWILGDDGSGNKLATALTTVYGSGSGGTTDSLNDYLDTYQ